MISAQTHILIDLTVRMAAVYVYILDLQVNF